MVSGTILHNNKGYDDDGFVQMCMLIAVCMPSFSNLCPMQHHLLYAAKARENCRNRLFIKAKWQASNKDGRSVLVLLAAAGCCSDSSFRVDSRCLLVRLNPDVRHERAWTCAQTQWLQPFARHPCTKANVAARATVKIEATRRDKQQPTLLQS